eukprot:1949612-Heterocapsa_arctica.AAC.1
MTLQVIQVCNGVRVMSPSVRLEHLVDHAQGGSPAQESALPLCTIHRRGEPGLKGPLKDALQDCKEFRIK